MKKIIKLFIILSTFIFASCEGENINKADDGFNDTDASSGAGKGGSLARFSIVDQTMYFVDQSVLSVYDVSNPKLLRLVNKVNISSNSVETIFSFGDYLYLGSSNGMFIYSIEDRAKPKYLSMATHISGCDPVVSDGKYAYVTVRNTTICNRMNTINTLEIYDVASPTNPIELSSTQMTAPVGLAIDGDVLFVCDFDNLVMMDVSDRSNPKEIKKIPSTAFDIIIDGDNILTVDAAGIKQYKYDRENLTLTLRPNSSIPL